MKRLVRVLAVCFAVGTLAVLTVTLLVAADRMSRPAWNQEEAVKKVSRVLELEKFGTPWDAIPWLTDEKIAVERAVKENKPLFVFYYLRKQVGPPAAPC